MFRLSLLMALPFILIASSVAGQNIVYNRTVPSGTFRTAASWSPFDPGFPLIGPGGLTDSARFDLGQSFLNLYTISNVNGVNRRLIIGNDSVRLVITNYELAGSNSIIVGESPGDVGIIIFTGGLGARLTSGFVRLGSPASTGSIIVDGPGFVWDTDDVIEADSGNLLILDGKVNPSVVIAGTNSMVNVSGIGSELNSLAEIAIDGTTNSFLIVDDGAAVSTNGALSMGGSNASGIMVAGKGSVVTSTGFVILDPEGNAAFDILDGGLVICFEGEIDSDGTNWIAKVSGQNSTWSNLESLDVGQDNRGNLSILDGGYVFGGSVSMGRFDGSIGTVNVDGVDSEFCCNDIRIGVDGDGVLNVLAGGVVESSFAVAADWPGSTGEVTINGTNSRWTNDTNLTIGGLGSAFMTIEQGGRVISASGSIAENGFGAVSVKDPNSRWINAGGLEIGFGANGSLVISNGGSVGSAGTSTIGFNSFSTGNVLVDGEGSSWRNDGTIRVGNLGGASLNIQNLGVVSCSQCDISDSAAVNLNGGVLSANSIEVDAGDFNFNSGVLHVGTYDNSLSNQAGTLAPGLLDNSAGMTQINGLYLPQANAVLEIEIGGTGQGTEYDFVQCVGDTFLDGELNVELINGFIPTAQQQFVVYNVSSGDLFGSFSNVADDERLETVGGEGSFRVDYGFLNLFPKQVILSDFEANFILGDVNGDGLVNLLDVGPFVDLIASGKFNPAADINMDGVVNLLDVALFVELLSG